MRKCTCNCEYRRLIELTREGLWTIDANANTIFVNQSMASVLGYDVEDMLGKPLFTFMDERGVEICTWNLERRKQGVAERHELEFMRKDGKRIHTRLSTVPLFDDAGAYLGATAFITDITEYKTMESGLRESERNLRMLFDSIRGLIFVIDSEGCIVHVNRAVLDRLGYSLEEMQGSRAVEVFPPDRREEAGRIFLGLPAGKDRICQVSLLTKDGDLVPVETTVSRGLWSNRQVLIGMCHDLGDRKRVEALTTVQRDLAIMLTDRLDLHQILELVVDTAIKVAEADNAAVYLVNEASGALEISFYKGVSEELIKVVACLDADMPGMPQVVSGEPIYSRNPDWDASIIDALNKEGIKGFGIIPVSHHGNVIGSLHVASHTLNEISSASRIALEAIASQVGSVIARLKSEEALRVSEERYSKIVNMAQEGIWIIDSTGRTTFANERLVSMFGYSVEELHHLRHLDLMDEEDRRDVEKNLELRKQGIGGRHDCQFIRKDGSCLWAIVNATPMFDDQNRFLGMLALVTDITERKEMEESLRKASEENERYRINLDAILRSMTDGIVSVDTDTRVIYANEALGSICPCLRDIQVGISLKEYTFPCDSSCLTALEQILKTKEPVFEYRIKCIRADRQDKTLILNSSQLRGGGDDFQGAVLIVKDISRLDELERTIVKRYSFGNIIGKSEKMREIYGLLDSLTNTNITVLVTGESGTGKELVAEALHYNGLRASMPLVKVNCSALSESLLESELFGHVRGAFTGAVGDRAGRFQVAEGGTILLDEIGDISPLMQLKLLRVLERKEFERVGESRTQKANVRIVVATNADLLDKVRRGLFREDLYYRLKVMTVHLPPLRERLEDIPLLTDHFVQQIRAACNKNISGASDEVMRLFLLHTWPGNVRELRYTLEHAGILCPGGTISLSHLPKDLREKGERKISSSERPSGPVDVSSEQILDALEKTEGSKTKAARLLGISRRTLYRRMEKYQIMDR